MGIAVVEGDIIVWASGKNDAALSNVELAAYEISTGVYVVKAVDFKNYVHLFLTQSIPGSLLSPLATYFTNPTSVKCGLRAVRINYVYIVDRHAGGGCNAQVNWTALTEIGVGAYLNNFTWGGYHYPPNYLIDLTNNVKLWDEPTPYDSWIQRTFRVTTQSVQLYFNFAMGLLCTFTYNAYNNPTASYANCESQIQSVFDIDATGIDAFSDVSLSLEVGGEVKSLTDIGLYLGAYRQIELKLFPNTYYVRSTTGSDLNNGTTWAKAKKTIVGALSNAAPGDVIYVSQSHNYYTTADIRYQGNKGAGSDPILIVCVDDSAQPPIQLATTAIENATVVGADIIFSGSSAIYWYGINFKSNRHIYMPYNGVQVFDNCSLQLTSATQGQWYFNTFNDFGCFDLRFLKSTFTTAYAASSFYFYTSHASAASAITATLNFKNCSFTGTSLTNLFTWNNAPMSANITMDGCDLSSLGMLCYLTQVNTNIHFVKFSLSDCKLNELFNFVNGAITYLHQMEISLENCDSGMSNTRNEYYRYQGNVKTSTSNVKTGGATNGVTPFSWIMTTNNNYTFPIPLETPPILLWCEVIGMQRTATLSFLHNSKVPLTSNDIWAEVEYQGSSTNPMSSFVSSKSNYWFSVNPIIYPSDTGSIWQTTGIANPYRQKLELRFTPQMKGVISIKVYLAKANYTVYIDPSITLI